MQPLLASDDEVGVKQSQPAAGSPRSQWIWLVVLLSYIPVVGLTIVGTWAILRSRAGSSASPQDTFPTLRQSGALKWERRLFPTEIYNNPYAGEPSPELDLAWHNLFEDNRIKVSKEDLDYYNTTSVPFADGSGYAAELGVMHELHCLKKIRHWIWKDYYLDPTTEDMVEYRAHVHHCLELMREGIMCRGDTSLFTFKWLPGNPPMITAVAKGNHACVNWESLVDWVHEHQYSIFKPGVLAGPEL